MFRNATKKDRASPMPSDITYHRQWKKDNPDKHRGYQLKYKYGITAEELDELWDAQTGRCAICDIEMARSRKEDGARYACVDHDHETRTVRGLLCRTCNVGLGMFGDNPELMVAAAAYVLKNV